MKRYSEIVEESFYKDKIKELESIFPDIYEVWEAISWLLGRNPYEGDLLPIDNKHYLLTTHSIDEHKPIFRVLYRYEEDEGKVYLLSLSMIQSEAE